MFRLLSAGVLGFCAYAHFDEAKKVESRDKKQQHEVAGAIFGVAALIVALR
jgi:hypothetical protein